MTQHLTSRASGLDLEGFFIIKTEQNVNISDNTGNDLHLNVLTKNL